MAKQIERSNESDINPQQPPSPGKTPEELLNELMSGYRSLKDIPDAELAKIGYQKTFFEEAVRIAPKEVLEKEAEIEARIEKEKGERAPFGIIKVEAKRKSIGRRLEMEEFDNLAEDCLREWLDGSRWTGFDVDHPTAYDESSAAVYLCRILLENGGCKEKVVGKFDLKEKEYAYFVDDVFTIQGVCLAAEKARKIFEQEWSKISNLVKGSGEDVDCGESISSKKSEEIYLKLEQLRGRVSDVEFLAADFAEGMNTNIANIESDIELPEPTTPFKISKFVFSSLLEQFSGLQGVAEDLRSSKTHSEFLAKMSGKRIDRSEEEKKIMQEIKTATTEEKIKKSQQLKAIKEGREVQVKILAGVIEYYRMPETVAKIFDKAIKDFEKGLTRGNSKGKEEEFVLDGRLNKDLDTNPGEVSGDCTNGKPLPFRVPEMPIYNIKVFKNEREHTGNIYLFMTNTHDDKPVWHLDAIQIPATVEWKEFIENLFDSLANAAREKGIFAITVSREASHISNYDYIQEAVQEYCKKIKAAEGTIKMPDDEHLREEYSSLQSNGEVFLIPVSAE